MKPIVPTADTPDDAFIRQMKRAVAALPDVPPALQQAAVALFTPLPQTSAAAAAGQALLALAQGVLTQVTAVLSFDSWALPATAAGMRSLRAPTRHLLFSAQGRDIDLRISPQAGSEAYALAGQILGPDERGTIELRAADDSDAAGAADASTPLRSVALDGLGEFRLDGLARGSYSLTLLTASERIALPPIEVGAATGEPAT